MTSFAGYRMPLQYGGILREHAATRTAATVFDTCHMGELRVRGPAAVTDLERLLSNRVGDLRPGRCRYALLCRPDGGTLDDLLIYRLDDRDFMLVVNAGTRAGDLAWIRAHAAAGTAVDDVSDVTAKIDLQGPLAPRIALRLFGEGIRQLAYFAFMRTTFAGHAALLSRTGYTGESGFEFYGPPAAGSAFWDACLEAGARPAGLGARDTLRLEAGLPLYGHELSEARNAGTAGLDFAVARDKDFIGARAVRAAAAGPRRIRGLAWVGRRAAREGDIVLDRGGRPIGEVTSGCFGPTVGRAIALACLDGATPGMPVRVTTERGALEGLVTALPFYDSGTARRPLRALLDAPTGSDLARPPPGGPS